MGLLCGTLKPKPNTFINDEENTDCDANAQRIWEDESTGKKSCMLSAKALEITWGDDERYWRWVPRDDTRFEQAAEANGVWWFNVYKRFDCSVLSPNTEYIVSFLLKVDKSKLLPNPPYKFKLKTVEGNVIESARFLDDLERPVESYGPWKLTPVKSGENGWMEFVAGEFLLKDNGGADSTAKREIEFTLHNTEGLENGHHGVFIDGVKIQPKQ